MNRKSTALLVVVILLISAVVIIVNLPPQPGWLGELQGTLFGTSDGSSTTESSTTENGTTGSAISDNGTAVDPGTVTIARPSSATLSHVAYVHDGDTLYLQPDGTSSRDDQIKVRLIGLNTPEVGEFGECFGTEARDYLRGFLPKGTVVWIKSDAEPLDKYGRSLLYLWTRDDRSVNLDLVEKGYATALNIAPSNKYWKQFDAAEAAAYKANAGLWGSC